MKRFNQLTDAEDERLSLLIEECAEVIQAAAKIKRHGYESVNPLLPKVNQLDNREELAIELGHVIHALDRMTLARDVDVRAVHAAKVEKADRIGRWLHHQHETPETPDRKPT